MARRLRIGLTGGIASGKTTAALRFGELGIPVIDADEVARAVVVPGQPGLAAVVAAFGPAVRGAEGQLDRRALRDRIFSDPAARRQLEAILHPLIQAEIDRRVATAVAPYLVIATPLLVEMGHLDRFDRILVIDVPEATQLERVVARDSSSLEQARAILTAQASRAARLELADDVLVNLGSVSDLRQAVDGLHERYLALASASER